VIKVAGYWEFGWLTPITEISMWIYMLKDFGVDEFYISPISGIKSNKVIEKPSLKEVLNVNKNLSRVYLSEKGDIPLRLFTHPEDALYITGKTSGIEPYINYGSEKDFYVKIETFNNIGGLWGHQATSIALYDRLIKNGSYNSR
jgi:hypothetical protein